jgi:hypothetical protein
MKKRERKSHDDVAFVNLFSSLATFGRREGFVFLMRERNVD